MSERLENTMIGAYRLQEGRYLGDSTHVWMVYLGDARDPIAAFKTRRAAVAEIKRRTQAAQMYT